MLTVEDQTFEVLHYMVIRMSKLICSFIYYKIVRITSLLFLLPSESYMEYRE